MIFLAANREGRFIYHGATYDLRPLTPPDINPDHILAAASGLEQAILEEHAGLISVVHFDAGRIPGYPRPLDLKPEEIPPGSRILLLRAGGIGDLIMLTPAIKEFRKRLNGRAKIILATYSDYADIFEELADRIISYPVRFSQLLRETDYYVDFADPNDLFDTGEMTDYYLDCLGIDPDDVNAVDKKPLLPASLTSAFRTIAALNQLPGRTKVLFAGGASDKIRRLPDRILAELASAHPAISFVVPGDSSLTLPNIFSIDTSGGLKEYVTAIAGCDAVVSTDSSAYHIAAAFDIPALVLFGPISSTIRTGFYPRVVTLDADYSGETCQSPCGISTIRRRTKLKNPIGENRVMLLEKGTAIQTSSGRTFSYDPDKGCPESCALDCPHSPCLARIEISQLLRKFGQLSFLEKPAGLPDPSHWLIESFHAAKQQTEPKDPNDTENHWRRAVATNPDNPQNYVNLGRILAQKGLKKEAAESYRQAIKMKPDEAGYYAILAEALYSLESRDSALSCIRLCLKLDRSNPTYWEQFTQIVRFLSVSHFDEDLADELNYCMRLAHIKKQQLEGTIGTLLSRMPAVEHYRQLVRMQHEDELKTAIISGQLFQQLAHSLLLQFLKKIIITNSSWESFLAALRRGLLEACVNHAIAPAVSNQGLALVCALASQCFLNEYIYPVSEEESGWLEKLNAAVNNLQSSDQIPEFEIALLAAYQPLSSLNLACGHELCTERDSSSPLADLIRQQVQEPAMERQLRGEIIIFSKINDHISRSVQAQYEENPYPRWQDVANYIPQHFQTLMHLNFPHLKETAIAVPPRPEVLIAGCGTGRQAIETALSISGSQVLAIDLSLASLAYARRKTRELEIANIEYMQADLLNLENFNHSFDIIKCSGVLHHLRDPQLGWKILTDLLKPGGYMEIALYSEIARQAVVAARQYIAKQSYRPIIEDIRKCRQEILALPDDSPIKPVASFKDFFVTSECRDLIFHVQEHRFTLPQIEAILTDLSLDFIGFINLDSTIITHYDAMFPDDPQRTNLSHWNEYELNNSDTFRSMYQFWLRKKSSQKVI